MLHESQFTFFEPFAEDLKQIVSLAEINLVSGGGYQYLHAFRAGSFDRSRRGKHNIAFLQAESFDDVSSLIDSWELLYTLFERVDANGAFICM